MFDPTEPVSIDTFVAERVHFYATQELSEYPMMAKSLEAHLRELDYAAHKSVLLLKSWCVAGRIPGNVETETMEYFDSGWEMFKEHYFPAWAKKRWPPQKKTVTINRSTNIYFVCPHNVLDNSGTHIRFMSTGYDFRMPTR